jgi:hypothetical protein
MNATFKPLVTAQYFQEYAGPPTELTTGAETPLQPSLESARRLEPEEAAHQQNRCAVAAGALKWVSHAVVGVLLACGSAWCYFYFTSEKSPRKAESKWDFTNPWDWFLWASGKDVSTKDIVDGAGSVHFDFEPAEFEFPEFNIPTGDWYLKR